LQRRNRRFWFSSAAIWPVLAAGSARACELALILAVDVSGSVDPQEYRTQMHGLAAGLRDGIVSEALVSGQAQLMLVQWTGTSRQDVSIPWTKVQTFEDMDNFADAVAATPRTWRNFSTAIGEALRFSMAQFADVPGCRRLVIDVSGDGFSNEGVEPQKVAPELLAANVTVNAVVIGGADDDLAGYFRDNVITGAGAFVVTADGFRDYGEKIRLKLRRETGKQISRIKRADDAG